MTSNRASKDLADAVTVVSVVKSYATMRLLWNMEKQDMLNRHIMFQEEDRDDYVGNMLKAVGALGAEKST